MINTANNRFLVVNAFAEDRFGGNPAGVFTKAEGLTDEEMQLIARQLNLVETVFVFKEDHPGIDRRLRYFTPNKELPIAGHPTIAAWVALVHDGEISLSERKLFAQRTQPGIQNISIEIQQDRICVSMEQEPPRFLEVATDRSRVAHVFGISESELVETLPIQAIDTGLGHIIVPVKDIEALMRVTRKIEPLRELCSALGVREAQIFCLDSLRSDLDLHTRNICPRDGIEDPACGVGNGALGAYLAKHVYPDKNEFRFRAEQGHVVNMPSVIEVAVKVVEGAFKVSVGGSALVMVRGTIDVVAG